MTGAGVGRGRPNDAQKFIRKGPHPFYRTEAVLDSPRCQTTSGFMAVVFISIGRMPFLAPSLDIAGQLFTLVITPGFYLHHIEVADPPSGNL